MEDGTVTLMEQHQRPRRMGGQPLGRGGQLYRGAGQHRRGGAAMKNRVDIPAAIKRLMVPYLEHPDHEKLLEEASTTLGDIRLIKDYLVALSMEIEDEVRRLTSVEVVITEEDMRSWNTVHDVFNWTERQVERAGGGVHACA